MDCSPEFVVGIASLLAPRRLQGQDRLEDEHSAIILERSDDLGEDHYADGRTKSLVSEVLVDNSSTTPHGKAIIISVYGLMFCLSIWLQHPEPLLNV
jgi:hypothetical protein